MPTMPTFLGTFLLLHLVLLPLLPLRRQVVEEVLDLTQPLVDRGAVVGAARV